MAYVKVKDVDGLVREDSSKAILNIDNSGLQAYKEKKRKEANLSRVIEEHDQIKSDLAEIKSLLKQLMRHQK
jgi:hypothetical protein